MTEKQLKKNSTGKPLFPDPVAVQNYLNGDALINQEELRSMLAKEIKAAIKHGVKITEDEDMKTVLTKLTRIELKDMETVLTREELKSCGTEGCVNHKEDPVH